MVDTYVLESLSSVWGMKRRPPWGVGPLGEMSKQVIPAVEPELRAQAVFSLLE